MSMTDRIPERFRVDVVRRLGQGGEAVVYELTGGRALRVFHRKPHGASTIAAFYRDISRGAPSFALPRILEQGEDDGMAYSLDALIPGRPLHELLASLDDEGRERALASYTDAAFEIAVLPLVRDDFGEFLRDDDSITAATWQQYLLARMQRSLAESPWLAADVPSLANLIETLTRRIEGLIPAAKALVHGDYYPGNVLLTDDFRVSGVIDFGPVTVIGDPGLDLASAVIFLEVMPGGCRPSDTAFVRDRLIPRVGAGIVDAIATYRGWYAIRFAPYRDDDPNLYAWCVKSLTDLSREFAP